MVGDEFAYRHRIAVRWSEVDQQGVVFNAHYLAYIDDALENWIRPLFGARTEFDWEMMLKTCIIEWQGSLTTGDVLELGLAVTRWGRTSWDLGVVGSCQGRPVFSALILYVSVSGRTNAPMETPASVREFMGEAIEIAAVPSTPSTSRIPRPSIF